MKTLYLLELTKDENDKINFKYTGKVSVSDTLHDYVANAYTIGNCPVCVLSSVVEEKRTIWIFAVDNITLGAFYQGMFLYKAMEDRFDQVYDKYFVEKVVMNRIEDNDT